MAIIENLPVLSTPQAGDELPIERGELTYKIDYNALAGAIINRLGTNGIVGVAHGGSGLSASPSVLVNLASSSAVNVMQASPRPGVTGVLPIKNGGTGGTTAAAALTSLSAAPRLRMFSSDYSSWVDVYTALINLPTAVAATVYFDGVVGNIITDGKVSVAMFGTVMYANGIIRFFVRNSNGDRIYNITITNVTMESRTTTIHQFTGTAL